jgi:aminopeptidase 2
VLYRESLLLFDAQTCSANDKAEVADTVAHEIAHQWFGNLVTMDWWDELWLNEGFATWVGAMAVDRLLPEMDYFTTFVANYLVGGMDYDALKSSHPIQVEVYDPAQVQEIFDAISYFKGASVIRMLEAFLGSENFKNGVIEYLKKNSYKNATTIDLWNALSDASGRDVGAMMASWTEKVGFPVVKVVGESFDSKKSELTLDLIQERFIASGDDVNDDTIWSIPINVVSNVSKFSQHSLDTKKGSITIPYSDNGSPFFCFNVDATGFYKTLYTKEQLARLAMALKNDINVISVRDRVTLTDDLVSFAKAGLIDTFTVLETLRQGFRGEDNAIALEAVSSGINQIKDTFYQDEAVVMVINTIIRELFSKRVAEIGFEHAKDDDYQLQKKRSLIIKACAYAGDSEYGDCLTQGDCRIIVEIQKIYRGRP